MAPIINVMQLAAEPDRVHADASFAQLLPEAGVIKLRDVFTRRVHAVGHDQHGAVSAARLEQFHGLGHGTVERRTAVGVELPLGGTLEPLAIVRKIGKEHFNRRLAVVAVAEAEQVQPLRWRYFVEISKDGLAKLDDIVLAHAVESMISSRGASPRGPD